MFWEEENVTTVYDVSSRRFPGFTGELLKAF